MAPEAARRRVAVLTEVAALDRALDYEVPEGFDGPTEPGSRVRVELHGRSVRGWIMGEGGTEVSGERLKPLRASLGLGPPSALMDLAAFAAWRWYGTRARFLTTASPERLIRALPARPVPPLLEVPATLLGERGAEASSRIAPNLVRLGPATDPFDLLLGFLAGLGRVGALEEGSLLVLVPGLRYGERLVARLARRGIPAVDSTAWAAARTGWPVVVGARSAAFAPLPRLAGVVVLDAEDERFVSESAPNWRAVDVVRRRAEVEGVPCLVVSAVPSAADTRDLGVLELPAEVERAGWARAALVDRRDEDPRHGLLSEHLVELSRHALESQPEGVAVACLVNRTGRARLLSCARCESIARCEVCDAALVLEEHLRCPRCGTERPVICQICGATKLKLLRLGTAQLAPELGRLLGVPFAELTASSGPDALDGMRGVVGTEAVLHRLRRTSLVALLDLDHHLLAPRVGAELRTLSLLARAGRLVGPRSDPDAGVVLLQTRSVTHPVVVAAQEGDPAPVLAADLELRESLGLPPFRALAKVSGPGAGSFVASLADAGLEVAALEEGSYALIAPGRAELCDALEGAVRPKERVVVAVDAESL